MSHRTSRLPLSLPNMVIIGVLLGSAIATAIIGSAYSTVMIGLMAAFGILSAVFARRPNASDRLRVSALEYADERDSQLGAEAFSVVGAAALAFTLAELIAAVIYLGVSGPTAMNTLVVSFFAGQVIVLNIVWGWAITRAVKRG